MDPTQIEQIGPYPVRRFIAEGGMAWVFEVVDTRFDAPRALKMLKPEAALGAEFQRFEVEAGNLARLNHPNLITVYDFGVDEATSCYYYTMALVEGPTLHDRMHEPGFIPVEELIRYFQDVLAGLAKLHDSGIVHRDIKPSNILLTPDGRALLSDLGIARDAGSSGLTKTGTAVGTALYMSPEQARGRPVSPASDVFSAGLTFYHALTEKTVYEDIDELDSTSGQEILMYLGWLGREQRELDFKFRKGIPRKLQEVIRTACRYDPCKRYRDASAMMQALQEAPGRPERGRSLPLGPIAAAVVAVAVAVLAGPLLWDQLMGVFGEGPQGEAEAAVDRLSSLEEQSAALVEEAEALRPRVDAERLADWRDRRRLASALRSRAAAALERGDFEAVEDYAETAGAEYASVCSGVGEELAPRAEKAAADASERLEVIQSVEPEKRVPEQWAEVQTQASRLEAPSAGTEACEAATAQRERLLASAAVIEGIASVRKQLEAEGRRLATTARDAAKQAEEEAKSAPVDEPAYEKQLAAARQQFAEGQRLLQQDAFFEAQEAYLEASQAFRAAAQIAPAAQARAETRRLESALSEAGVQDAGPASPVVSLADRLYVEGKYGEALEEYEKANGMLQGTLAEVGRSRAAREAARKTAAAREEAVAAGAERDVVQAFRQGDEEREKADEAFTRKDFDAAERGYVAAARRYADARTEAQTIVREAAAEKAEAWKSFRQTVGGETCEGFRSRDARARCDEALADLREGNSALDQSEGRRASAHYQTALENARKARELEQAYLAQLPKPPEITSSKPARQNVSAQRNKTVRFSVQAADANNDELRYRWLVDGQPQPESGPQLDVAADRDVRVEVQVSDRPRQGDSQQVSRRWNLSVSNTRPKLSLRPTGAPTLEVGDRLDFSAQASDPDGDRVRVEFLMNGKKVATGGSFQFQAREPGRYTVTARAVDESGAVTSLERTIQVREDPAAVAARQQEAEAQREREAEAQRQRDAEAQRQRDAEAQRQAEAQRKREEEAARKRAQEQARREQEAVDRRSQEANVPSPAVGSDSDAVRSMIVAYEDAYASCDVDKLGQIWKMSGTDRLFLRSVCRRCGTLDVTVRLEDIQVKEGKGTITFQQWVECTETGKLQKQDLRAQVVRRTGGDWQIFQIYE